MQYSVQKDTVNEKHRQFSIKADFLLVLTLIIVCTTVLYFFNPYIGVKDADAYAYIVGAYSIQSGDGYKTLLGEPLNHWPPGFSFLLSLFANPLSAALIINYISFGVAVGLLYILARKRAWTRQSALSLSLATGFGFFSSLASNAKPDILTYAVFLLAVILLESQSRFWHVISVSLLNVLIIFKLIAVVFTPAILMVKYFPWGLISKNIKRLNFQIISGQLRIWFYQQRYKISLTDIIAMGGWFLSLSFVVVFNFYILGMVFPESHPVLDKNMIFVLLYQFFFSIFRSLLSHWYGSIKDPLILTAFVLVFLLGIWCLSTLRLISDEIRIRRLAVSILSFSWMLQIVRSFDSSMRLMGYGVIILPFAFRPLPERNKIWLLYGIASVLLCFANLSFTNSLGASDPRYRSMAHQLEIAGLPDEPLFTNSFHLLDIHIRHPTIPVTNLEGLPDNSYFLWVSLPNYDAIATIVTPMPRPRSQWCEVVQIYGATLFQKCRDS